MAAITGAVERRIKMDAVKYLKEAKRMCDVIGDCRKCPINGLVAVIPCKLVGGNLELANPEKAVEIVEKWASENPKKTRQSEFLKMFPNALKDGGVLVVRPCNLEGTTNMLCESKIITCEDCKREYWLTEVE